MTNGELFFWIGIGAIALSVLGGIGFGALFHHMGKKISRQIEDEY